ncbi:hypothetical protein HWV62_29452 [Athelia sp. TMB]|nr:hypothetical protein HWV62_29452 [Athelia sp. TMB]
MIMQRLDAGGVAHTHQNRAVGPHDAMPVEIATRATDDETEVVMDVADDAGDEDEVGWYQSEDEDGVDGYSEEHGHNDALGPEDGELDVAMASSAVRLPDEIVEPMSIAFDLLAVSWIEIVTGRVFTRVASLTGEPGREIVLQLKFDQAHKHSNTILAKVQVQSLIVQIVSPQLLLVAGLRTFLLYEIPPLKAIDEHGELHVTLAQPIWSTERMDDPVGRPFVRCLPSSNVTSCVNVVILGGSAIFLLALSKQPEKCRVLKNMTISRSEYSPSSGAMASRHAFWAYDAATVPGLVCLRACAYPLVHNRPAGSCRLYDYEESAFYPRTLEIPVQFGRDVMDLSWDESGKLCVLVSTELKHTTSIILLLDFA